MAVRTARIRPHGETITLQAAEAEGALGADWLTS